MRKVYPFHEAPSPSLAWHHLPRPWSWEGVDLAPAPEPLVIQFRSGTAVTGCRRRGMTKPALLRVATDARNLATVHIDCFLTSDRRRTDTKHNAATRSKCVSLSHDGDTSESKVEARGQFPQMTAQTRTTAVALHRTNEDLPLFFDLWSSGAQVGPFCSLSATKMQGSEEEYRPERMSLERRLRT